MSCINAQGGKRTVKLFQPVMLAVVLLLAPYAYAEGLSGVYNTGPSETDGAAGASLNVEFSPCLQNAERYCATVLEVVEPEGPSGEDLLPDGSPVVGYVFITGLKLKKEGKFRGGKILAVDESIADGKMKWFDVKIDDNFDGTLTTTGCLAFICPRKMTWTRVEGGESIITSNP